MTKKTAMLSVSAPYALKEMGAQIRTARLRRNLSQALLAERANITPLTLQRLERGEPGVSMGIVANVLVGLNLLEHLLEVANPQADLEGAAVEGMSRRRRAGRAPASASMFDEAH